MEQMKKILLVFVIALTAIGLIGCKKDEDAIMHTIVFVNTDLADVKIADGELLTKPSAPTKEGYQFDDWYKDAEFAALFDFTVVITKDTMVYANFTLEEEKDVYISLAEAITISSELEHDSPTTEKYYITGTVKSIDNIQWGNMVITDGTNDFVIYGMYNFDGTVRYDLLEDKPVINDVVYLYGSLSRFFETVQMKDSWLVKMEEGKIPEFDVADYSKKSVADARASDAESKVIVEGIVTRITFANGFSPNGFFLVDETGVMYVFDYDIASSVSAGDTIEVAGTRKNFILPDETNLAESLGYEGAIQLADAHLISKTQGTDDFDKSWIEERTIKELLETDPKVENITGNIYKVNAFVKEVPGSGFTNYYINDLDEITGSYSYSMNNGKDFDWLKEYDDGQLRTVYLAVLNAKSTVSGLLYRFVPIEVEGKFTYNENYNAEFAVKYFGVDQFDTEYIYSPDAQLITSVSSVALGISDVALTYTSSNEDSVKFEEDINGNIIFKVVNPGTSTITITSVDGLNTYFETIDITVLPEPELTIISVADAISMVDNTDVVIEGIVGPSLVNKTGFYLIDETGAVAVEMITEELNKLQQGNKVVISGIKTHAGQQKDEESGIISSLGQLAIRQAVVTTNKFGSHEYSTASFKSGKTLVDFVDLDKLEEHATNVYVFDADIFYEDRGFFTRYQLQDNEGSVYLNIYSSSGSQLSFLEPVRGLRVEVEFTVVNWNGKSYVGSVLSYTHEGVKVINNSNFR